ncbi:MAG TPA: hydroxymethylglutaryl-CoA lyase [Pseudonocardia sp.]|nr:hydroxymethylglutaryl-CoA lyase [Pseudonocardia sp.]
MPDEPAIEIVDVSPRDGLQNERKTLSTEAKVELVTRLIAAGARRIEVTSFVNPAKVPQLADAEELMRRVPREPGVRYIGLALNERGVSRALAAGVDEVNFVVVASDTFNRRNQGVDTHDSIEAVSRMAESVRAASRTLSVTIAAAFGCPFEGEVPVERVVDIARAMADLGVDELALADTIGVGVPADVTRRLGAVQEVTGPATLRCHFHDTRNTAVANAVAAYAAGVRVLDASAGGVGGCPFAPNATGNVAVEDLVYAFERSGVATGLDLARYIDTASWLGEELERPLPGALHRAGPFPEPADKA